VIEIGAIYGLDRFLSRYLPVSLVTAQPSGQGKFWYLEKWIYLLAATGALSSRPCVFSRRPRPRRLQAWSRTRPR
jgi:hypothetical protein